MWIGISSTPLLIPYPVVGIKNGELIGGLMYIVFRDDLIPNHWKVISWEDDTWEWLSNAIANQRILHSDAKEYRGVPI